MKAKYTTKSKNKFDVMYLTDSDFKFQTVAPDDNTSYVDPAAAERAAKEAEKAAEKAKKAKEAKENANTSAK